MEAGVVTPQKWMGCITEARTRKGRCGQIMQQTVQPGAGRGKGQAGTGAAGVQSLSKDTELAVYDAVVSLIRSGSSLAELTVADIAQAAGIGKGTIYNYFRTKDEIVAKALVYTVKKHVHTARLAVQKVRGFDRRMEAFLLAAEEAAQCRMPFFDTLTGCRGLTGGLGQHVNEAEFVQSVRMEAAILIEEIRRAALRERILRRDVPPQAVSFVIAGAFASYLLHINLDTVQVDMSRDEVLRQVIRSLKVSLAAM